MIVRVAASGPLAAAAFDAFDAFDAFEIVVEPAAAELRA